MFRILPTTISFWIFLCTHIFINTYLYCRSNKQPAFSNQGSLHFHFNEYSSHRIPRTYSDFLSRPRNIFTNQYPVQAWHCIWLYHWSLFLASQALFLMIVMHWSEQDSCFTKMYHILDFSGGFFVMSFSLFSSPCVSKLEVIHWCGSTYLTSGSLRGKALIWGVGQFLWYKYFLPGQFQATSMIPWIQSWKERHIICQLKPVPTHTARWMG